jgi:hypothetical protein
MPLTPSGDREALHRRAIECQGWRRGDGLFDIEAHLIDAKTYAFPNADRGQIEPGEPVHDMWIRLTVDSGLVVRGAEAAIDSGPFGLCPEITPAYGALVGEKIGPGWSRTVRRIVGGTKGCRHLVELLATVATVAYQTVVPLRERLSADPGAKPAHLDSCHALASDSPVVKRHYPKFYTGR